MDNSVNTTPTWGIRIPEWDIPTVTDKRKIVPSPGTTKEDKATRPPQKGD